MGLPDVVEPRLMRAAIEAVKQHRLHREREEMERGDWSDLSAEPLSLRAGWRSAYPTLRSVNTLINVGGDGNDFALFVSAVLQAIGARVRLSVGCSKNATLLDAEPRTSSWASAAMQAKLAATWRTDGIQVCQMFAEVRLGRDPSKIKAWVRAWLPGSKWLGKAYHYRLDQEGFVWLNLDWVDGSRLQRPGVPFKDFDWTTTYYTAEKSCTRNSDLVGLHDTEHGSSHSLALHIGGR